MKKISLYIHIPFCIKKCGYCDFISFVYDKEKMVTYLSYLKKELNLYAKELSGYAVDTIFIGGGTPSLMSGEQMMDLMAFIRSRYNLSACREISMESNPGTLSVKNLEQYKKAGINRISIGVQTLNNKTLKSLDRIHDVDDVYKSVENFKAVGFNNFNMDLMFGLPGQSLKDLEESIDEFIKLNPTHISAYSLKYEEGTDFYKKLETHDLSETSEALDREMYHLIIDKLKKANYKQYEISNFSKETYECKHNLIYWEKKAYIGFGLGAHSCFDKKRFYNVKAFDEYFNLIEGHEKPIEGTEDISLETDMFESIMLSLRLNKGLNIMSFNRLYKVDFRSKYKHQLEKLKELGLVIDEKHTLKISSKGSDLLNQVLVEFLE